MSDTPRTDEIVDASRNGFVSEFAAGDLFRQLERENAELKEGHRLACERTAEVLRELDELRNLRLFELSELGLRIKDLERDKERLGVLIRLCAKVDRGIFDGQARYWLEVDGQTQGTTYSCPSEAIDAAMEEQV